MRKTHYASIALLLAVNLLIGPQFINTASGAEVEQDFDDDGVVEDLQVSYSNMRKIVCAKFASLVNVYFFLL